MRRTVLALATVATAVALSPAPPAAASHPCLDWTPLTCQLTRPCIGKFCT